MNKPMPDGKPSVLIRCSASAETDPRLFYSTSYGTSYNSRNTMNNQTAERNINKQFRWAEPDPSVVRLKVQAAGYQRNLLPCFDYDKAVDEYEKCFGDENHYDTTMGTAFGKPNSKSSGHSGGCGDNSPAVINGPELSKYQPLASDTNVKHNAKWNVFESTMKSSYKSNTPLFPHLDQYGKVNITGRDHESGYVCDREHPIAGLSDQLSNLERGMVNLSLSERMKNSAKAYNLSKVGETAFNRTDHAIPESDSSKPYATPHYTMDRLCKMSPEDHAFLASHAHNAEIRPVHTTNGIPQAAAAVHNTEDPALLTAMQFRSWDTSYSTCYNGCKKLDKTIRIISAADHSGYSLCNKFGFEPMVKYSERPAHEPRELPDAMQRHAIEYREKSAVKLGV